MRIFIINIVIFFSLLGFMHYSLPAAIAVRHKLITLVEPTPASLPVYADKAWAEKHFREFAKLKTRYYDYYGWRRLPFSGETINISSEGIRKSTSNDESDMIVYFFGGSAMWGSGSRDEETIPSFFSKLSGAQVVNYGESSWRAFQSVALLAELFATGHRPGIVIFYDGFNDVYGKCLEGANIFATGQLNNIRSQIVERGVYSYQYLVRPIKATADRLIGYFSPGDSLSHDCHLNPEKAEKISDAFAQSWNIASFLADKYGSVFIPVLQPNIYSGSPRLNHLSDLQNYNHVTRQFETLYPLISEKLKKNGMEVLDLTNIFNVSDMIYYDQVHIIPEGNFIVAEAIFQHLKESELLYGINGDDSAKAGPNE